MGNNNNRGIGDLAVHISIVKVIGNKLVKQLDYWFFGNINTIYTMQKYIYSHILRNLHLPTHDKILS